MASNLDQSIGAVETYRELAIRSMHDQQLIDQDASDIEREAVRRIRWCGRWEIDLDGQHEARAVVAQLGDMFVAGIEHSQLGGEGYTHWGPSSPTQDEARLDAERLLDDWVIETRFG